MELLNVQNKTKHVSFQLYAFVRHKSKNNKPLKDIHIYKLWGNIYKYIYIYI